MSKQADRDARHGWSLSSVWKSLKAPPGVAEVASTGKAAATEGAHKVQLEDMLLLLHRTSSTVSDSAIFSERGMSLEGWAILREIGPDGSTVAGIARNLRISRRRVGKAVTDLADRGAIEISRSDRGRRAARRVSILPKGGEILSNISSHLKSLDHAGNERSFNRGRRVFKAVLRTLPRRKKPVALDATR